MTLFYAISHQWSLFQGLGLSPLESSGSKYGKILRNMWIMILSGAHFYFMVLCLQSGSLDRRSFAKLLSSIVVFCMSNLIHIIGLIIFIELFVTGRRQNAFLRELAEIDSHFVDRLQVDVKYRAQKQRNLRVFVQWTIVVVVARVLAALTVYRPFRNANHFQLVTIYFMVTLRMYQYTMFADMIKWRYALVNQYINDTYTSVENNWLIQLARPSRGERESVSVQRLRGLRGICRAIHAASQCLNELFPLSLSLCIFYDFTIFFLFAYDTFKFTFLEEFQRMYTVLSAMLALASANNLFTMSSICQATIDEVRCFRPHSKRCTSHLINGFFPSLAHRQNVSLATFSSWLLSRTVHK